MNQQICGRCRQTFNCQVETIEQCACAHVPLTDSTKRFLKKTYYDCLCANCLQELNALTTLAESSPVPGQKTEFAETVHYYVEGNRWVFTEFYHIVKGSCCGNRCRHCAYGFPFYHPKK